MSLHCHYLLYLETNTGVFDLFNFTFVLVNIAWVCLFVITFGSEPGVIEKGTATAEAWHTR